MFPVLDQLFPGSDLLQRYWFYTTTRVHRDRQSIHAFQDNLSITPIQVPTADAFHAVMQQSRLLETAKNILSYKIPFDLNPAFTSTLLINFQKLAFITIPY